eukprot:7485108-Pyramimonas_sp.AAC.1
MQTGQGSAVLGWINSCGCCGEGAARSLAAKDLVTLARAVPSKQQACSEPHGDSETTLGAGQIMLLTERQVPGKGPHAHDFSSTCKSSMP